MICGLGDGHVKLARSATSVWMLRDSHGGEAVCLYLLTEPPAPRAQSGARVGRGCGVHASCHVCLCSGRQRSEPKQAHESWVQVCSAHEAFPSGNEYPPKETFSFGCFRLPCSGGLLVIATCCASDRQCHRHPSQNLLMFEALFAILALSAYVISDRQRLSTQGMLSKCPFRLKSQKRRAGDAVTLLDVYLKLVGPLLCLPGFLSNQRRTWPMVGSPKAKTPEVDLCILCNFAKLRRDVEANQAHQQRCPVQMLLQRKASGCATCN